MMKKLLTICFFMICLAGWTLAPGISEAKNFDLFIVPTFDRQLDSWTKIPSNLQPTIFTTDHVYPGQPFALRLLFKYYTLSPQKNSHITYNVEIFSPAGKPTGDRAENLLAYQGPVQNPEAIITNQEILEIYFDESYHSGDYEIQILATDRNSNLTISRKKTIELRPLKKIANFASEEFYLSWIKHYYRHPDIGKALFGSLQFLTVSEEWLNNNSAALAFINQLLNDNPWLWPHLTELFLKETEYRDKIAVLMAINNQSISRIEQNLTVDEQQRLENFSRTWRTTTKRRNHYADRVNELWGRFYATGHLEPFEKLVRFLKPFDPGSKEKEKPREESTEQFVFLDLIEHLAEVPLTTKYATYLKEHRQLPQSARIQLRLALETAEKLQQERNQTDSSTDKKKPLSH